jgi:hypothetical protein
MPIGIAMPGSGRQSELLPLFFRIIVLAPATIATLAAAQAKRGSRRYSGAECGPK